MLSESLLEDSSACCASVAVFGIEPASSLCLKGVPVGVPEDFFLLLEPLDFRLELCEVPDFVGAALEVVAGDCATGGGAFFDTDASFLTIVFTYDSNRRNNTGSSVSISNSISSASVYRVLMW